MAGLRALDLAKPFLVALPEVPKPFGKVDDYEKLIWVLAATILYFVMTEIPLYGAKDTMNVADPISWLRDVIAASPGTAAELGVMPTLLAGFSLQLLAGLKSINVSLDLRSDRVLFQSAQKLIALTLVTVFSVLLVLSGTYGSFETLGLRDSAFLISQLIAGGTLIVYMDELLQKGYGMGTGALVFGTLKVSQKFTWALISMNVANTSSGPQYFGAIPNLFSKISDRSLSFAVVDTAFRVGLPNLLQVTFAVVAFMLFVGLSSIRYNIPIRSTKARATNSAFPIRLFYTNAQPILFWASILAAVHLLSASLYRAFPTNLAVQILGKWEARDQQLIAVSGLAYYLCPPENILAALWDPIRSIIYVIFTVVVQIFFAQAWTESSGFAPSDIAKQFKEGSVVIVGHRDSSAIKELRKIIPLAAAVGGAITGSVVAAFDIVGAWGWGAAMAVGALNTLSVFEILAEENIGTDTLANLQSNLSSN